MFKKALNDLIYHYIDKLSERLNADTNDIETIQRIVHKLADGDDEDREYLTQCQNYAESDAWRIVYDIYVNFLKIDKEIIDKVWEAFQEWRYKYSV